MFFDKRCLISFFTKKFLFSTAIRDTISNASYILDVSRKGYKYQINKKLKSNLKKVITCLIHHGIRSNTRKYFFISHLKANKNKLLLNKKMDGY